MFYGLIIVVTKMPLWVAIWTNFSYFIFGLVRGQRLNLFDAKIQSLKGLFVLLHQLSCKHLLNTLFNPLFKSCVCFIFFLMKSKRVYELIVFASRIPEWVIEKVIRFRQGHIVIESKSLSWKVSKIDSLMN